MIFEIFLAKMEIKRSITSEKSYDSDVINDWDLVPSSSMLKLFQANTRLTDSDNLNDWDVVPSRTTLKLFQANKRLKQAQTDLIVKRITLPTDRINHCQDWEDVQDSKNKLRKQFRTINKTICDNKASKYRLNLKTKELLDTQILVQDEIENNKLEIEKYSETKENMEKYVTMYSELFTRYLEKVAQNCVEFNSVQDILNEYEILENCKSECSRLLNKEMNEALELRRELMKLVEEKSSRFKDLHNSLVMIEVRRRKAAEVCKHWNNVVRNVEQVIADRFEESVTLREGCYSLYQTICNKRRVKPIISKEDTKTQMASIGKTIQFYKDVLNVASSLQQNQRQEEPVCSKHSVCW